MKKTLFLMVALCAVWSAASAKDVYDPKKHYMYSFNDVSTPLNPDQDTTLLVQAEYYDNYVAAYGNYTKLKIAKQLDFDISRTADDNVTATIELLTINSEAAGATSSVKPTLRIHGTGRAAGYAKYSAAVLGDFVPWLDLAFNIQEVIIETGITQINDYLLYDLPWGSDPTAATILPDFPITLPSSLESINVSAFPEQYSGVIHCRAVHAPDATYDDPNTFMQQHATICVPFGSEASYKDTSWWKDFTTLKEEEQIVTFVPKEGIYNTQATIVCELISNAVTYHVEIKGDGGFHREFDIVKEGDDWKIATASAAPRRYLPIIKRDTVRSTVETVQIDITGLEGGKNYEVTIKAQNDSKETVSKKSCQFTTTTDKATSVEEVNVETAVTDERYYNILGQPVAPEYRGVVIHRGKKTLRR